MHKCYNCSYTYMLTTKLAHGLYCDATVVDYDFFIKLFNIGGLKYPAHARLHKD